MKQWIGVLLLLHTLYAVEDMVAYPPVFAYVTGVAENDALNVRAKPDYRSKKVASLPNEAYVGLDRCRKTGCSVWCKVHHMAQYDYEGFEWDVPQGWVHAGYLLGVNRGYVLVDGKPGCDYILGCEKGMCDRVVDYRLNQAHEIISLKTEKIARARLKGASRFGAMEPEGDGYCVIDRWVEDYLTRRGIERVAHFSSEPAYQKALAFIKAYDPHWPEKIEPFIHPQKGLRVGYDTHFSTWDRYLLPSQLKQIEETRQEKFLWGYKVNEEKVVMSLYALMMWLAPDLGSLKEVQSLSSLRGFPCAENDICKGYVFYSYDKPRELDFSWMGTVVIMKKINGKWYVAGLLRDRWTI